MCTSLDPSKIFHTQNISSFLQGSKTCVVEYIIIAHAWEYGFQCAILYCICPTELDLSDENDNKTQDMSDRARYVRNK